MSLADRPVRLLPALIAFVGSLNSVMAAGEMSPDYERAVGAAFEWGEGPRKDYGAARAWYERAAAHGSAAAVVALGVMVEDGLGVPADAGQAVTLYRQAAALGSGSAELRLGMAFEWGRGVPRDQGLAAAHYAQAVRCGEPIGAVYAWLMRLHPD